MPAVRLIALLDCLDHGASPDYTHGAVRRELWDGGWEDFYDFLGVANLWENLGVSRFLLYAPFGIYVNSDAVGQTIGATKSQFDVISAVLGPRQAQTLLADGRLVDGVIAANQPGFITFWQGIAADFAAQGGEYVCYQGAPPLTTSTAAMTLDSWVQEPENCGMSIAFDACGDTDRLSYGTPVGILADRLALRKRPTFAGQHALLDPRTNGWFDGRFGAVSTKTRSDLVWTTPTSYAVPNLGQESVVLLRYTDVNDPATRLQTALGWLGRVTRGSPWTVAVDMRDMTDGQITTLVQAGGG